MRALSRPLDGSALGSVCYVAGPEMRKAVKQEFAGAAVPFDVSATGQRELMRAAESPSTAERM